MAEVLIEITAEIFTKILSRTELVQTELMRTKLVQTKLVETELVETELIAKLIIKLKAQIKIRQLKELKVFNSLRLFVVLLIAICY